MMASLPTSQDHIPSDITYSSGCVNIAERSVNAYVFMPDEFVTDSFSFVKPTFVYGEQVDEYALKYLDEMETTIEDLGVIHHELFIQLKECLKQSALLKRKYRKQL